MRLLNHLLANIVRAHPLYRDLQGRYLNTQMDCAGQAMRIREREMLLGHSTCERADIMGFPVRVDHDEYLPGESIPITPEMARRLLSE